MRSAVVPVSALLVLLIFVVVGAPAGGQNATKLDINEHIQQIQSGPCPDPYTYCAMAHPGSIPTGYCAYGACFEMSYGGEVRVVAADDSGDFPRKWFIWHKDLIKSVGGSCTSTFQNKNKIRVDIPEERIKCRLDWETSEYLYHEHFASNPATGCLGWVECREPRTNLRPQTLR